MPQTSEIFTTTPTKYSFRLRFKFKNYKAQFALFFLRKKNLYSFKKLVRNVDYSFSYLVQYIAGLQTVIKSFSLRYLGMVR